jgi:SsrA-binding protein
MGLWDEAGGKDAGDIALARGKALYDKREALAKKEAARDVERAVKSRFRT